jgi:putative transposase
LTFQVPYFFFVIEHGRRRILHFNITSHPTSEWMDRDPDFNGDVITFLKATSLQPMRTSVQAPWQNGIAERWVGSCRREILDHVIALNEPHLRRLMRDYVNYHHDDRIHDYGSPQEFVADHIFIEFSVI